MIYLGIDYGTRRVGISVSDEGGTFAFPFVVLENNSQMFSEIETIVQEKTVGYLVVGMPKPGGDLDQSTVRTWAEDLASRLDLPLSFQDETLTSHFASSYLSPSKNVADSRDAMRGRSGDTPDAAAAALILQRYLDKKSK
jgi:putative Holliday junction resolvase